MTAFTGELRTWDIVETVHGTYLVGKIFHDPRARDGIERHTSLVTSVTELENELHVVTMNSVYRLEKDQVKGVFRTDCDLEGKIKKLFNAAERWKSSQDQQVPEAKPTAAKRKLFE